MPHKNMKSVLFELVLIVLTMSVIGHLTVNFWERYFVKSELAQMKESLYKLKNNLLNIGKAYDALHKDIKGLSDISGRNPMLIDLEFKKFKNNLDKRRLHGTEVNAMIAAKHAHANPIRENKDYKLFSENNAKPKVFFSSSKADYDNYISTQNKHRVGQEKLGIDNNDGHTSRPVIISKPLEFYPFRKNEDLDIMTNADQGVIKHAAKTNVSTLTRNMPRSVGTDCIAANVARRK